MNIVLEHNMFKANDVISAEIKAYTWQSTVTKHVEFDYDWGLFPRVSYFLTCILKGVPTKVVSVNRTRYKLCIDYVDEDNDERQEYEINYSEYRRAKEDFDKLIEQLPDVVAARVNTIMLEEKSQ